MSDTARENKSDNSLVMKYVDELENFKLNILLFNVDEKNKTMQEGDSTSGSSSSNSGSIVTPLETMSVDMGQQLNVVANNFAKTTLKGEGSKDKKDVVKEETNHEDK